MKKVLKWLGLGVGGLLVLVLLAVAGISLWVEADMSGNLGIEGEDIAIPSDPESVAEGRRLAALRGCANGCHGEDGQGAVFFEVPDGSRVIAPNLPRLARRYTIPQLEAAIRHGVRPDGDALFVMPSDMFSRLADADLARIIAWLRSVEPAGEALPATRIGPLMRVMYARFRSQGMDPIAVRNIDHGVGHPAGAPVDPLPLGEYLAMTVCTECHGPELKGDGEGTPDLVVAKAYGPGEFVHLMRTGEPRGGNELDLMARVARSRFTHFTDAEIESLFAYLQAR